jgi:hypothetical protein
MMLNLFKVLAVFVAIISVTTMGIALSTFIVAPDLRAEMNTVAMQNYTFEKTSGENPQWTVTRRFSVNAQAPDERGSVGTFPTGYDALIKAHQDLRQQLSNRTNEMSTETTRLTTEVTKFTANQQTDTVAVKQRIEKLKTQADAMAAVVQQKSDELQAMSVKSREIRDETAERRTDVLRLRHELEELRTDLFRLTAIRRDLTDRVLRLEIENQELQDRNAQLNAGAANPAPVSSQE